jgi:putative FmdB family regulatory protein
MPLHDYTCQDCQHRFEYLVRNTRQLPPQLACPSCGSTRTRRSADTLPLSIQDDVSTQSPPASDPFSLKTLGRDLEKKR